MWVSTCDQCSRGSHSHLRMKVDVLLEIKPHERATYVVNQENDPLLGLPVRYIRGAFAKDAKVVYQYCLS